MGVMSLAIGSNEVVKIQAEGPDEEEAMESLINLLKLKSKTSAWINSKRFMCGIK